MIEREVKLRVRDLASLKARLNELGWAEGPRKHEKNYVYDTPVHALKDSGKLLRVREIDGLGILTVKLPSASEGPHKVKEEIEFSVPEADALHRVLEGLGYRRAWTYEKYRTKYVRPGEQGIIDLDETPIGDLLELEGEAAWIDATAASLDYGPDDYLTGTYRDLFDEWSAARPNASPDMVFTAVPAG